MNIDELPQLIHQLVGRCEIGENTFDNDAMSVALKFGELLWSRLTRFAEHYERQSENFMPGDIRAMMMAQAAKDMRHILNDTKNDMKQSG